MSAANLYSDVNLLKRTAKGVWLIIAVGTLLFTALAAILVACGLRPEVSVELTFPIVVGLGVFVLILAHRHDFMRSRLAEMRRDFFTHIWYWFVAILVLQFFERYLLRPMLRFDDPISNVGLGVSVAIFVYFLVRAAQTRDVPVERAVLDNRGDEDST